MIKILDCTVRDGGHLTNWNFDDEFIIDLFDKLNQSGIKYCEIGYRNHFETGGKGRFYNCTTDLLKSFYKFKGNLQIGVMTDVKRFLDDDFPGLKEDYLDFIRIAAHPDEISKALEIAEILHDKGYKVFVQLMAVSLIDEFGYLSLFEWDEKEILESLYFADSYGTITTDDVEKYFYKLKSLGFSRLSFHGHNNSNLVFENSLRAIELGAYSVDVTRNGEGRRGGNLDAKKLLDFLHCYEA